MNAFVDTVSARKTAVNSVKLELQKKTPSFLKEGPERVEISFVKEKNPIRGGALGLRSQSDDSQQMSSYSVPTKRTNKILSSNHPTESQSTQMY